MINLDWTLKHHQEVFGGIQDHATCQGWEVIPWPFAPDLTDGSGNTLYDGIVGRVQPELEEQAVKANIPLINVWVSSPSRHVPAVLPDLEIAGRMAASHLAGRGFRRFGFVGYTRTRSSQWLQNGFREASRTHQIKTNSLLVSPSFSESVRSWSRFQKQVREWLSKLHRPIGIATLNDKLARYVINAAIEMELDVPGDVAVIGLENEEVVCLRPEPSISSIDLGWHQIGESAGKALGRLMNGDSSQERMELIPPVSLVPRKSTDAFDVADETVARALRFIAEHSDKPIKVRDVVNHVPMSGRSLERRFQMSRAVTIKQEIIRFRIERAKRLLAETDLLIKQVAEASGFANSRRLCEVFRRLEGTSPEQFRKHLNGNEPSS